MDLKCPTTGERCAYREGLPGVFTTAPLSVDTQRAVCITPDEDESKLGRRLVEHSVVAQITECGGMDEDGRCPTAQKMAASRSRRTLKGVLGLFRK